MRKFVIGLLLITSFIMLLPSQIQAGGTCECGPLGGRGGGQGVRTSTCTSDTNPTCTGSTACECKSSTVTNPNTNQQGNSNPAGGNDSILGGGTCGDTSINTAIGCVPIGNQNELVGFILRWAIGVGGGIAFILILIAGFQIMTSAGDPKKLQAGKELLTSAIGGLILLIFSVFILRVIGIDILQIGPTFGS